MIAKIMDIDRRIGLGTSMGNDVPSGSIEPRAEDFAAEVVSIVVLELSSSGLENKTFPDDEGMVVGCCMVAFERTMKGLPNLQRNPKDKRRKFRHFMLRSTPSTRKWRRQCHIHVPGVPAHTTNRYHTAS